MELLGDRSAAEHTAPFKDQHFLPGLRQIGRADQAVVATTDDDRIRDISTSGKGTEELSRNSHWVTDNGE